MEKPPRVKPLSKLEHVLKTRLISDVHELTERLELERIVSPGMLEATQTLPMLFPESMLNRIRKGDPNDPILLQFIPSPRELEETPGFDRDPLCEQEQSASVALTDVSSCILQKYYGRVLVIATNACACQCRFCFRRYFPKNRALFPSFAGSGMPSENDAISRIEQAFKPIQDDDTISEIILSGGDPLTLSNGNLKALLHYIGSIAHVKRVRFHSRVPILSPQRIDDGFPTCEDFPSVTPAVPRTLHLVLHVDSPNEIDEGVSTALVALRRKGFVLTSQTTLLRGVNDNAETLVALYDKLVNLGVLPYYLHQLDRVQGAAHFETPIAVGKEIIKRLSARLPGYAVPRYVREIPGRMMKTNLFLDGDDD